MIDVFKLQQLFSRKFENTYVSNFLLMKTTVDQSKKY